jgi:hypothetical protein
MSEQFELPVEYNGKEYLFPATLLVTGYTHQFIVVALGQEIIFEPDEDRNYRAVIPYEDIGKEKTVDQGLMKAIVFSIEQIVK